MIATCEAAKVAIIAMGPLLAIAGPKLPFVLGGGLVACALLEGAKKVMDQNNHSSKAEEHMDKLVGIAAKSFDKHMKAATQHSNQEKKELASRFQDRVKTVKAKGKTFEGREKAKKEGQEREDGQAR